MRDSGFKRLYVEMRIQVQETQQKLQKLEQAINANESRTRQLESDLKALNTTQWQVSSLSQLSVDFFHVHLCKKLSLTCIRVSKVTIEVATFVIHGGLCGVWSRSTRLYRQEF